MVIEKIVEPLPVSGAALLGSSFQDVNLAATTIHNANLSGLSITECKLDQMRINGVLVADLLAAWQERA